MQMKKMIIRLPVVEFWSHKHLFKHGFFDLFQLFAFTLMKGDKVVEVAEVIAYSSLFINILWYGDYCIIDCIRVY